MTRDEFESRYRLLQEVTAEGGATTHHALGPAGAVVMVHFLQEETARRVARLMERPEDVRPDRLLETFDVDGSPVLVTKFIMDFRDLGAWMDGLEGSAADVAAGAGRPSPTPEPPAAASSRGVDAGTAAGEGRVAPAGGDLRASGTSGPEEGAPPRPPSRPDEGGAAADAPGEFTRLFEARTGPAAPSAEPDAGPRDRGPSTAGPPSGDSTAEPPSGDSGGAASGSTNVPSPGSAPGAEGRAEEGPGPAGSRPAEPAIPEDHPRAPTRGGGGGEEAPGEFTALFRARSAEGGEAPAPEAEPRNGESSPTAEARMEDEAPLPAGGAGQADETPPPPPGARQEQEPLPPAAGGGQEERAPAAGEGGEPGEFTRFFEAPDRPGGVEEAEASPAPRPGNDPLGNDPLAGPGEFTRLFEVPPEVRRPPKTPRASPPPPPPERPRSADAPPSSPPERPPPPPPPPTRSASGAGEPAPPAGGERPRPPSAREPSSPPDVPEPRYGAEAGGEGADAPLSSRGPGESYREPGELTARFRAGPPEAPGARDASGFEGWSGGEETGSGGDDTVADDYLERLYDRGAPPPPRRGPGSVGGGAPPPAPSPPSGGGGGGESGRERGPSAYTRVISGFNRPEPPSPAPSPPKARRPEPRGEDGPSMMPFLIGIAVIVVLAVGLVVGYVLITAPEPEPAAETPTTGAPESGESSGLLLLPGEHEDQLGLRGGKVRG